MNLEDGGFCLYPGNGYNEYLVSDELAEKSINAILTWPTQNVYNYEPEAECFGEMPSGIYHVGRMMALVVNATYGRFIASLQMGSVKRTMLRYNIDYPHEASGTLTGLAVALAEMRKGDPILQLSLEQMKNRPITRGHDKMYDKITQIFQLCESAELKDWRKWNRTATKNGISAFYFT